jgi:hypothetical protein
VQVDMEHLAPDRMNLYLLDHGEARSLILRLGALRGLDEVELQDDVMPVGRCLF